MEAVKIDSHVEEERCEQTISPTKLDTPLTDRDKMLVSSLSVQYALNSAVQTGLFPATLSHVQEVYAVSHTAMSALVAIYDALQMVVSVVVPHFAEIYGMDTAIKLGATVCGVGTLLYAFSFGYWMLTISQTLNGVGSACLIVLCPPILNRSLQCKGKGALYLSVVYGVSSVGVVVAYLLAGLLGPSQWRALFVVAGFGFVVPVLMLSKLGPVLANGAANCQAPTVRSLNGSTKNSPVSTPTCQPQSQMEENLENKPETLVDLMWSGWVKLKEVSKNEVVVFTILSQAAVSFYISAFIAFLPKFVEVQLGMGESVASIIVALTIPAATGGMVSSGYLINSKKLETVALLRINLYCSIISLPLNCIFFFESVVWFGLLICVDMFVIFFSCVPSIATFAHVLSEDQAPFANGLCNFVIRLLGSIPGPLLLGVLLDSPNKVTPRQSYFVVGLAGCLLALTSALVALKKSQNTPIQVVNTQDVSC